MEEAITCHRQALALRPHDHRNRPFSLNGLAIAMSSRFKQLGRLEDLEEAITCHREALDLPPHGHPDRPSSLENLATAVTIRFRQSKSYDDLLDAVKYLSEARNILPTGDIVSESHESLFMMTDAFELFEHSANHSPASAKDRFHAAVIWARKAHRRDHQSAVHAYTKSLTLLSRRLILAPTIESQQSLLASVPTALTLHAAPCSISRGKFKSAIGSLEQGRAVLWSKLRGYRSFAILIKSFLINLRP